MLLDSHAILHRAYHALPDFSSRNGEPTGALYGLASMLISIVKELKPDYIIAAFDLPKPTYRHEAYTDYKAGRKEADKELVAQIKRAYDFFRAFNIPIYEKEGYEADDVLGTLAEKLKSESEVIIASGDMDTLQLVDKKSVQVYTLKKGIKDTILYDENAVRERFGFGPELLPDYKGLRGDPSDNIIGVSGIGEKTATTLISKFGSIKDIYKTLRKFPEKLKEAGITDRILNLLKDNEEEAEFSKMLATIRRDAPVEFKIPEKTWRETVSADAVQALFRELDFRTLAVRVKDILPAESSGQTALNLDNSSSDLLAETKIALWLVNSSINDPQLLDILNYTGESDLKSARSKLLKEIDKDGLKKVFEDIEKPLIPVVSEMEKNGVKIDKVFLERLSSEYSAELSKLEREIWKMSGAEFNINSSQQLSQVLFEKMQLKYKGMRKTSTGRLSTREDVLQKLKSEHEIVGKILEYREFQKLLSTYIDNIPKLVGPDGRLHANFPQTGTTTGRMSSNNPNLQNIPIGTERGRKIREAFVAEEGNVFVSFDYSQIELRIAAILSKDKKMIGAFKNGDDIHRDVASKIFAVSPDKVTKEMRRRAKIINFGILYGMGVNALKESLNSSREEAQTFYNQYFKIYTDLANYLDQVKVEAAKNGFTRTLFGRRRYFDGFKSPLPYIRAQAERMAINAPIQGTAADLIKRAMVLVHEYLKNEGVLDQVKIILQIHDEVIYEMNEKLAAKYAPKIQEILENALTKEEALGVPVIVDCLSGKSWGDMKKM